MKLEELKELADSALARWQDPSLPKLPGDATVKFCSPTDRTELLPGLNAQIVGINRRTDMAVMIVDAVDLKKAITRFKKEF